MQQHEPTHFVYPIKNIGVYIFQRFLIHEIFKPKRWRQLHAFIYIFNVVQMQMCNNYLRSFRNYVSDYLLCQFSFWSIFFLILSGRYLWFEKCSKQCFCLWLYLDFPDLQKVFRVHHSLNLIFCETQGYAITRLSGTGFCGQFRVRKVWSHYFSVKYKKSYHL